MRIIYLMMSNIYFDYAATTPLHPEVKKAMEESFDTFGNPSSIHRFGREARALVEGAREKVSLLLGAEPEEIFFTSGGTESNNLALIGIARSYRFKGNHIITSSVEHPSVIRTVEFLKEEGYEATFLQVDRHGLVEVESVAKAVRPETILISIMHCNNEIGTIEPIEEIGRIAREREIPFHTDAVQSAGIFPLNDLNADLISISGHKIYAPKGVGVLYVKKGTRLSPIIWGGEQENQRRAGTENLYGIVALGKAAELALQERERRKEKLESLASILISEITSRIEGVRLLGHPQKRSPHIMHFLFDRVEGESLAINLDIKGFAVSTGSACSSQSIEPSQVLLAIGLSKVDSRRGIRFSIGDMTTEDEVKTLTATLPSLIDRQRKLYQA